MPDQFEGARVLHIEDTNALAAPLQECSQSGQFLCIELPSGQRLWVHPEENLRGLVECLGDPHFLKDLETASEEFQCGRGLTLHKGETPESVLKQTIASNEFQALLDEAAGDANAARGSVFDSCKRPAP